MDFFFVDFMVHFNYINALIFVKKAIFYILLNATFSCRGSHKIHISIQITATSFITTVCVWACRSQRIQASEKRTARPAER